MSRLAVPPTDRPELSVVMVTYNAWEWTQRALEALLAHTDVPLEVIVADNASADGTLEGLAGIRGLAVLRNPVNLGFGPAANQAALRARAPLLLVLNTDALVHPGWLPPLRAVLDAQPDVAAVSPRLLHLDGSVQEAGSILWGDAEVWPYGATGSAAAPEYRFRRDVDYASAACLLLRRSAFGDAGGFDPAYAPAYYEDVDLCLRLWDRGLRTVCQPLSEVTHAGGASTDRRRRAALLERNRAIFVERWRGLLARRPPSPVHWEPEDVIPGRDLRCDDRVLVVGDFVPDAREPRLERLLRALVRLYPRARITCLALDADGAEESALPLLGAGVELAWPGDGLERWLHQRRHHYGVVLAASWAASSPPVRGLLDTSQPLAHRVVLLDGGAERDLEGADYAATVRSARLVLCADDGIRVAAERVGPRGEVVVLDGDRSLTGALAGLGMAPALS
ncbi:MAG TPA: glycosyltransferase family 2 protein, partial [Candidatus Dormibacteraeota bacterium]|nr:glycosyltransferase family 2 protein [Candidatus Dormibacteraeota bacterium]